MTANAQANTRNPVAFEKRFLFRFGQQQQFRRCCHLVDERELDPEEAVDEREVDVVEEDMQLLSELW